MKDAMQSTNEDIGVEAPAPGNLLAGQRTVVQKVRERLGDFVAQATAAFALVLVFIFLSFASPVFLTQNNLVNIVQQNAVTLTIALGMTFVIITAGIDLSVGSTAAMTGVLGVSSSPVDGTGRRRCSLPSSRVGPLVWETACSSALPSCLLSLPRLA